VFDGSFRTAFDRTVEPLGRGLKHAGIPPDAITALGVVMAAGCAVAIGAGNFPLALVLLALTGLPDALDGAVAKAAGTAGPRGAFFDSVSDRLSDGLIFAGAAWYLAGTASPRMAMLPFALFVAASLVSYQRAKAESLGFEAKGGLMERAERFVVLAFGLAFSALFVPVLWVMLGLTVLTAVTRFRKVWLQASGRRPVPVRLARRNRRRTARPRTEVWRERAQARAKSRRNRQQG
jgi:CDP-diacylglycerol--glycerol-3-phosphate 3-phosphatidyltransferase